MRDVHRSRWYAAMFPEYVWVSVDGMKGCEWEREIGETKESEGYGKGGNCGGKAR